MAFIYLDESGQFQDKKNKRSVVGGVFCKNSNFQIVEIINFFNSFKLPNNLFHGKDLDDHTLLAVIDKLIEFCKEKELEPIIFIPQRGFYIIDDTRTYINILIDGIINFIQRKKSLINTISDLTIVIEHRKNLKGDEYKTRIHEAVAKAFALSPDLNKSIIPVIKLENKNNSMLQIADAIVHTFYRYDKISLSELSPNEIKIIDAFKEWIEPYKIYIHNSAIPNQKIIELLDNQQYVEAINQFIQYYKKDKSVDRLLPLVIERLCILPIQYLNSIMQTLLSLYYIAVNENRSLYEIEKDIKFILETLLPEIEKILPNYNKRTEDIQWAYCYCYMIMLTLSNHRGDCSSFADMFERAMQHISKLRLDIDALSVRLRMKVLLGVHYINMYQFEECYEMMNTLEKNVSEAFAFLNEADESLIVRPRIIGEIIGTKLQAAMYDAIVNKKLSWDIVRKLSDNAINTFTNSNDIQRQYQYRSQIEAYAGNYTDARAFIAKGVGIEYTDDYTLCAHILKNQLLFPLLHFLRIYYVEIMNGQLKNIKTYYEIVTETFGRYYENVNAMFSIRAYPVPSIFNYLMVLCFMNQSKASIEKANTYYTMGLDMLHNDDNITIGTIELSMRANYLWAANNDIAIKKEKEGFEKAFHKMLQKTKAYSLHDYLQNALKSFQNTSIHSWNTLWHIFPF